MRLLFETDNANYTPKLYNVTVSYTSYSAGVDEISLSSSTQITDNNWHYSAVTFDNDTLIDNFRLYLDGSLNNSKTEHNTSQYTTNDLYIGKNYQSTSYFNGVSDECKKLADKYLKAGLIPEKYRNDALHIAVAVVNKMDVLISWNMQHIVKLKTVVGVNKINKELGYKEILIYTPEEVIE